MPIKVASRDTARATELRSALEIEIGDVLKRRLVRVAPTRACSEGFVAKCAIEVRAESGRALDEVAQVAVTEDRGRFVVDITVREAGEGNLVFHESVRQGPNEGPGVVAAALRRAFDPASWSGRIVVTGVPGDAEVFVDGLRMQGPSVARVGSHVVLVRTANGFDQTIDVRVEPGAVTTVAVDAAPTTAARSPVPALALGGVGFASAGVAAAFAASLLVMHFESHEVDGAANETVLVDRRAYLARLVRGGKGQESPPRSFDPTGAGWETGYGSVNADDTTASTRLAQIAALHGVMEGDRALGPVDTYGVVAASMVAAVSFVGCYLAWPTVPDESDDAAATAR